MMWQRIRAVWQDWSILIVGLVAIFGAISLGGYWSSSTSSTSAPPSHQARDQGKPAEASFVTNSPSPQGGGAKQSGQQVAQSTKAPSPPPPATQAGPAPSPQPSPAPSNGGSSTPPMHDHMATSSTQPPSGTIGQSPATPPSNAMPIKGDASAGRLVFRKCQACHSIEAGKNMLGPSLAGVFGRKAGTETGFNYSPAMKSADITWSSANARRIPDRSGEGRAGQQDAVSRP